MNNKLTLCQSKESQKKAKKSPLLAEKGSIFALLKKVENPENISDSNSNKIVCFQEIFFEIIRTNSSIIEILNFQIKEEPLNKSPFFIASLEKIKNETHFAIKEIYTYKELLNLFLGKEDSESVIS